MIRVLIADSQAAYREQLRVRLSSDTEIDIVGLARDGQEALQIAHQLHPDVVILSEDLRVHDGFKTIELLTAGGSATQCILISDIDTPEQLRKAMRAGAREHMARPFTRAALLHTIHDVHDEAQRRQTADFTQASDPNKMAKIFPVTAAKGGVGKTTLSTNLAVALQIETGEPTVLFDLYTQYGDVAMLLNMAPRRTLVDMEKLAPSSVDLQLVEDYMETHETGLRVLFSSKTPVSLDALTVPYIEQVLNLLKTKYRYIVIDVPPYLYAPSLHALSVASTALLVANMYDLTTINDTRLLIDTIAGNYVAREKLHVILNRVTRKNRLSVEDIERAIGHPANTLMINDGQVVAGSINQGTPFVITQPNSAIGQSVRHLARTLAGIENQPAAEKTRTMPTSAVPAAKSWALPFLRRIIGSHS